MMKELTTPGQLSHTYGKLEKANTKKMKVFTGASFDFQNIWLSILIQLATEVPAQAKSNFMVQTEGAEAEIK